jgi:hypothetical protein
MSQQLARLAKTTVIFGLGQVLIRFISLLLLPLFTAYPTPTEYGISAIPGLLALVLALGALALVVVQHVWNLKRRRDYFGIAYEWNRVLKFALISLLYIVPFVWNRSLPLQGEAFVSAAAALTLPTVLYLLLSQTERDALWRLVNHWVLRRGNSVSVSAPI